MRFLAILCLAFLAPCQFASAYRILGIFPVNGKSHWNMMEELMKGLAKRGHQVDVVTHFELSKPLPNYREISIKGTIEAALNNVTAEDIKRFTSINNLVYKLGHRMCNLMKTPQIQTIIKNPPNDPPYDLFITEMCLSPCYLAFARHLKVPAIGLVTTASHEWSAEFVGDTINPAFQPNILTMYNQNMTFLQRLINTFMFYTIIPQLKYYISAQRSHVLENFGMDVSVFDLYQDLALLLMNSHHSLHGIKPLTHAVVEVGGLHIPQNFSSLPPEIQKWLDESKDGCIYMTFGSMVKIETFPKELIETFYNVFRSIAPVRVLMKVAKKEDLLPGLPENVMIQPWFPQIPVLKHKNTRAFITHGGLMGTQEAIFCAVPLIGIPLFGDQHINIKTYVEKKVAISLNSINEVTEETLGKAIHDIMHDPSYRENMKKLSEQFYDRPMTALDTAIYWVEYVGRNKFILQSPAVRMSWWQRNLLDVYATFLLVIVAALSMILFVLMKVKNYLCGRMCNKKKESGLKSKKMK